MQHTVFVVVAQLLIVDNFLDLVLAILVVDLVREVAREHERFVADGLNGMVQRRLRPFATDKNSAGFGVPAHVVAHFLTRPQLNIFGARVVLNMSFPTAIEALEASLQPGHAGFHKPMRRLGYLSNRPLKITPANATIWPTG